METFGFYIACSLVMLAATHITKALIVLTWSNYSSGKEVEGVDALRLIVLDVIKVFKLLSNNKIAAGISLAAFMILSIYFDMTMFSSLGFCTVSFVTLIYWRKLVEKSSTVISGLFSDKSTLIK